MSWADNECQLSLLYLLWPFICRLTHKAHAHAREHRPPVACVELGHAKGCYLATVSFNRTRTCWEGDPGSVPNLQGCAIWQLKRVNVPASAHICAHKCCVGVSGPRVWGQCPLSCTGSCIWRWRWWCWVAPTLKCIHRYMEFNSQFIKC